MRTGQRIRRFAKWITLALFVISIAAWVFSVKVCYAYVWTRSELRISDGQIQYYSGIYDGAPGWHRFAVINDIGIHLPKLRFRGTGVEFIVPFWLITTVSAVCTAILCRTERVRRVNHCPICNYNLTANETGTCPECGTPTPKSESAARVSEPPRL